MLGTKILWGHKYQWALVIAVGLFPYVSVTQQDCLNGLMGCPHPPLPGSVLVTGNPSHRSLSGTISCSWASKIWPIPEKMSEFSQMECGCYSKYPFCGAPDDPGRRGWSKFYLEINLSSCIIHQGQGLAVWGPAHIHPSTESQACMVSHVKYTENLPLP